MKKTLTTLVLTTLLASTSFCTDKEEQRKILENKDPNKKGVTSVHNGSYAESISGGYLMMLDGAVSDFPDNKQEFDWAINTLTPSNTYTIKIISKDPFRKRLLNVDSYEKFKKTMSELDEKSQSRSINYSNETYSVIGDGIEWSVNCRTNLDRLFLEVLFPKKEDKK